MIKRPMRILYFVKNMRRAQTFYRDVLGLEPVEEDKVYSAYLLGKGVELGLHRTRGQVVGDTPVLVLEVRSTADVRTSLRTAKAKVIRDFHEVPGGVSLNYKDPDGHELQLIQYMCAPKGLA